ncbi:MAG TPA: arylesterase [Bryobacteraceae bacterium]|nr:arylesterase [Bryobacteraceae bacterium]
MRRLSAAILAIALCSCSRQRNEPGQQARESTPTQNPGPAPGLTEAAKPDGRRVLAVFGDSIAAGFGLEPGQSFPDDLQRELDAQGYAWRVVNLGISGDTTEGGVSRMDSALSLKPGIVILELGGNDGLRGLPLSVTRKNLETMIETFQDAGAQVVLAGMTLPPNYGPDYIHRFEQIYKDLAAQYKLAFIPFLLSDIVTADLRYLQRDGIHPTAEGAEIVSGAVFRAVKPLLSRPAGKPANRTVR